MRFCIWFRFKSGNGFAISNESPLFSERIGARKCKRIFGIKFERLEK